MKYLNDKLAGENLLYSQALVFLDATIDDINSMLGARYPSFTEFVPPKEAAPTPRLLGVLETPDTGYSNYPNYNFIPEKYIRSVVIPGAALKFYTTDEEGAQVANQYSYDYRQNLFYMQRDYTSQVPLHFQDCETVDSPFECPCDGWDDFRGWSL